MAKRKRILIVDDEPIVCERLRPPLEKAGFEVETCTDGQQAVDRLAQERFDILVTDLKMRKPDGLDVLAFARAQSPTTRAIVITGFPTVDSVRDVMRGGAVDLIPKPFKISQLRDLILKIGESQDTE
jgi:DNA-binding NtrC family response regulator